MKFRILRKTPAVLLVLLAAVASVTAGEKRRLSAPTVIDEVPCERLAWVSDDGRLESCFLSRDATLNGQKLPRGTKIGLDPDGKLDCVFLPGTTRLQGHDWRGHGHDYQTCFWPNGQLRFGNLARSETIQGVPCEKSTFLIWVFRGNAGVTFHEDGKLKGCLLAEAFEMDGREYRRGDRFEQGP